MSTQNPLARERWRVGDLVHRKASTRVVWRVFGVHERDQLAALLDLELIDTGAGPPAKPLKCRTSAEDCRKAEG